MSEQEPTPKSESGMDRATRFLTSANGLLVAFVAIVGTIGTFIALVSGQGPTPTFRPDPTFRSDPTFQPDQTFQPDPTQSVPTIEAFTIDDWADAADAACQLAGSDLAIAIQTAQSDLPTGFEAASSVLFSLARSIREIPEPSSRAVDAERYAARLEDAGRALSDGAFAYRAGNGPAVELAAQRYDDANAASTEVARGLGAHQCAALGEG
jgi:hypothetical protein